MESVEVGEVGSGSPGSSGSGPLFAPARGRAALGPFSLSSCTTMNRPRTYMYDGNRFSTGSFAKAHILLASMCHMWRDVGVAITFQGER